MENVTVQRFIPLGLIHLPHLNSHFYTKIVYRTSNSLFSNHGVFRGSVTEIDFSDATFYDEEGNVIEPSIDSDN